jgi:DNA-binding SARP family transcriptional activator
VLRVAPGELDALGFEVLGAETAAARSDPARCLALCEEALALWRGAPYGDFAAEDPFRLEVIRLEGMRMFLIELRIECEIVLGNEALVVGALEALVEEYPYRERIWHLLIVALSLCGRRVEALAACTRLRELLATVGLEPAMQIRALEGEILVEDPQVRPRLRSLLRESARAHSREDR